jgi:hypothetical protein
MTLAALDQEKDYQEKKICFKIMSHYSHTYFLNELFDWFSLPKHCRLNFCPWQKNLPTQSHQEKKQKAQRKVRIITFLCELCDRFVPLC